MLKILGQMGKSNMANLKMLHRMPYEGKLFLLNDNHYHGFDSKSPIQTRNSAADKAKERDGRQKRVAGSHFITVAAGKSICGFGIILPITNHFLLSNFTQSFIHYRSGSV